MFHGSIVALVTPFTKEGEVDLDTLQQLIEWHIEEGTDAIVLCGTTGESPTLSDQEQESIFQRAVSVARGRIPLIAGTGTYDTRKSVEKTRKAKEIGVDACLVIVPYYNRPTPEGCIIHYQHIASVGLPVIVYHHPGRTGVNLSSSTLGDIANIPNIVAIKEASGGLALIKELSSHIPIFAGDDALVLPMMELGAKGVISVMANLMPRAWKEFVRTCEQKDFIKGRELHDKYVPLCQAVMLETNPQGIKYALGLIGKCSSSLRLPLIEPSLNTQDRIKDLLLN
jgi:4-hydroxy-tetrahydrodipicolinate synthase